MEIPTGEETFKYIPFRCYHLNKDYCMVQKLVKPTTDQGKLKTLGNLIEEVFPDEANKGINRKSYWLGQYN